MMSDGQVEYDVTSAHIVQAPRIHNGRPFIVNSSVLVQDVYMWHEIFGCYTADEIASKYNVTIAQVYAALTFAFDHVENVERYIQLDMQMGRSTPLPDDYDDDQQADNWSQRQAGD